MLGIKPVQAVGHLMSLWHFVLRNAWRDADLEPWGDIGIEMACRWDGKPGELVKAMRAVKFLDESQVHGWLERAGKLVRDRLYNEGRKLASVPAPSSAVIRRKPVATLPNTTLPNPTKRPSAPNGANGDGFEQFWDSYPRKVGKEAARKAWRRAKPSSALVGRILESVREHRACDQWQRDGGQYIPHPATFLNQGRWDDDMGSPAPSAESLVERVRR
jgi:hypothetical protein